MVWFKFALLGLGALVGVVLIAGVAGYMYVRHQSSGYFASLSHHGGVEIHQNGLIGRFYAPKGVLHHTSVLMLGGSNGGYPYDAAAQDLANSGYPVFALAYFQDMTGNPKSRPKYLANIELEYFFRALDWMKTRTEIDPERIILMGESRGGELVLLLASHRPDVAGVIAYSPSHLVWAGLNPTYDQPAWTLNGKPLPFLRTRYAFGASLLSMFQKALAETPAAERERATIPVENIHGPVLLISSKSDGLWPSSQMADAVAARLHARGFCYPVENLQYADSSHLLMGYGPGLIKLGIPYIWEMNFGGSLEGTRKARDAGWAASKAFLAKIAAQ
ncbi:dienelactone hydrolase [Rhizomicrobium palustre]|uniref:Dienelactone hydrolase n=1 Tax=Rhizomicrobium palustre TaxID=189966 RepID=A0A846MWR6_9PROT|nr:acyl-CoA thioester hydrolase/BAAT C-terminal domain-containing protein [Rhizomicrobium palustre]NIK87846.1 dienelactone hydrolase [Rhizomicrobium palustre]